MMAAQSYGTPKVKAMKIMVDKPEWLEYNYSYRFELSVIR